MADEQLIVFTVKELLQRLDERLGQLDQKLDLRLVALDERITHIERVQSERQHLIEEHRRLRDDVAALKTFKARFVPVSLVVGVTVIANAGTIWLTPFLGR